MATNTPRRELYRLWFEFLKRAIAAGVPINKDYYEQWLPVEGLTFNQWWKGFEPKLTPPTVTVLKPGAKVNGEALVLSIPLNMSRAAALVQAKSLLDEVLTSDSRQSYGRFAPTANTNIKYASFRLMLHCYDSEQGTDSKGRKASRVDRVTRVIDRYRKNEERYAQTMRSIDKLPKAIDTSKGVGVGTEDVLRNYYRAVQKAKRIINNVAKGDFPGKYQ